MLEKLSAAEYQGRVSDPELNRQLLAFVNDFIESVRPRLSELGYQLEVVGSLKHGQAIHLSGDRWVIRDVDFRITKAGKPVDTRGAMMLRRNQWFFTTVQSFLTKLAEFYSNHGISNSINEVDFLYGDNPELGIAANVFAIGSKSRF